MPRTELKPVTAERLPDLQGTDWIFGFMKRYPRLFELHRGIEEPFLEHATYIHVHANPDSIAPRSQDVVDVALDYSRVGARAA